LIKALPASIAAATNNKKHKVILDEEDNAVNAFMAKMKLKGQEATSDSDTDEE